MFTIVVRNVKTDRITGYLGGDHQTFVSSRVAAARFPSPQAADAAIRKCLSGDERKLRHVNLTIDDGSGATI